MDDLKIKIDELNMTSSHDQHIKQKQQQSPNKTFQNFSKSKQVLETMIENIREELAGISKITTQEVILLLKNKKLAKKKNYLIVYYPLYLIIQK